jgi:group I intron endonuclease
MISRIDNPKTRGKYYFVYKTTCIVSGKIYVGAHSTRKLDDGYIGDGICVLRHAKLDTLFHRAVRKYGYDNFKREIIEFCSSNKYLEKQERFWIQELKSHMSFGGYNMTFGGFGGDMLAGRPDCEELRRKGAAKNKGRHHTDEAKKLIAITSAERWKDEEYKKRVSQKIAIKLTGNQNSKGVIFSKEARQRQSIASIKKWENPEYRNNMTGENHPMFNKHASLETREKQRKAKLGKKQPVITCPVCGKQGGNNIKHFHFDNCKYKK